MKQLTISTIAIFLFLLNASCSEKEEFLNPDQVKSKIQELINNAVIDDFPGLSITVLSDRYNYTIVAGKSNKATNTSYSENTLNYVHSISKTFTAVAVLKLKEQGSINLNATINQYLAPEICDNITNGNIITVKQLLTMKSGIADYTDNPQFAIDAQTGMLPMSSNQILQYVYNKPAHFAPGAKYEYSNINYFLLALIIDSVTSGNHQEYITNNIINQFGLMQTFYIPQSSLVAAPSNATISYSASIVPNQITDVSALQFGLVKSSVGDDGIISTTNDIAKFYKQLLQEKSVVSANSLEEMTAPDNTTGQPYYGMGLYSYKIPTGQLAIGHNGSLIGAAAEAWYFPERKITIVLSINIWSLNENDPKVFRYYQLWDNVTKLVLEAK